MIAQKIRKHRTRKRLAGSRPRHASKPVKVANVAKLRAFLATEWQITNKELAEALSHVGNVTRYVDPVVDLFFSRAHASTTINREDFDPHVEYENFIKSYLDRFPKKKASKGSNEPAKKRAAKATAKGRRKD
jgi:hypothetical protein